jgi:hypothetical protein
VRLTLEIVGPGFNMWWYRKTDVDTRTRWQGRSAGVSAVSLPLQDEVRFGRRWSIPARGTGTDPEH